MKLLALIAASLLAVAPAAEAKCSMQYLAAEVLPDAPGGAIVMMRSSSVGEGNAHLLTWTVKNGSLEVKPRIDVLAPGLSVYRLPKGMADGELVDGETTLAKVTALTAKPLPAPKVKSVKHSVSTGRGRTSRTTASITGDVPTDAVAIVITDEQGNALSFGKVLSGQPLEPYFHGRCGVLPDGTIEPSVGDRVRLFWVDKYGRASTKSAVITVVKGT